MIARILMSVGLGAFWILVGSAAGLPGTGLTFGIAGALFIWVWTMPRRRRG